MRMAVVPMAMAMLRCPRLFLFPHCNPGKTRMCLSRVDAMGKAPARLTALIEVDARVIGAGLGLDPARVQEALHDGSIATLCERGIGEDLGCHRVTFYCGKRRLRLLIDGSGNIIEDG